MSEGIELITAERQHQVNTEGWTAEHDQRYFTEELALAAACYAIPPIVRRAWKVIANFGLGKINGGNQHQMIVFVNLQRQDHLIAAEIDRIVLKDKEKNKTYFGDWVERIEFVI